jgi:chemotaxis response regulator CheB
MRQIRKSGVPSTRRTANASHAGEAALPLPFPVVGLGASAGGIPALERFFANLPGTRAWPSCS